MSIFFRCHLFCHVQGLCGLLSMSAKPSTTGGVEAPRAPTQSQGNWTAVSAANARSANPSTTLSTTREEPFGPAESVPPSPRGEQPPETPRAQPILDNGQVARFAIVHQPHHGQGKPSQYIPNINPEIVFWFQPLHTVVELLRPRLSQAFTHLLKFALYPYFLPPDLLFLITQCGSDPHRRLHYI